MTFNLLYGIVNNIFSEKSLNYDFMIEVNMILSFLSQKGVVTKSSLARTIAVSFTN